MRNTISTGFAVLLATLAMAPVARADDDFLAPGEPRTASWYAKHAGVRARILQICNDDPGAARHNRDCFNAHTGAIVAGTSQVQRQNGLANWRMSPRSPAYWRNASAFDLQNELAFCSRMNPQQQADNHCDAVRAGAGVNPR